MSLFKVSLSQEVEKLLSVISGPFRLQQLQKMLPAIVQAGKQATPEDLDLALERLTPWIARGPLLPSSLLALCSGALVEEGGNPQIPFPAILQRAQEALEQATAFAQACRAEAQKQGQSEDETELEECLQTWGSQVVERQNMQKQASAWSALDPIIQPTNAILMRLESARATVRNDTAFMAALNACPAENGAIVCLRDLLLVLEHEELIVLHPALQRGYRVCINGVGDNFQLHTLLADALIGDPSQGWLSGKKPDARVAAAAKDGPFPLPGETKNNFPSAEGAFNLWNWQGLQPDGTLPGGDMRAGSKDWIWNEGKPADIAFFEGRRVILLSPPPYQRTWNAGRYFPGLKGELTVQEILSEQQVRDWLGRIAAAAAKEHS